MTDLTPNLPEVVAEVGALFERYEQALMDKTVEVLDATFWDSPHTIRYALHEHGYGFAAIHAHRVARPPGPGIKEVRLRLEILTLGPDLATVNLEFTASRPAARVTTCHAGPSGPSRRRLSAPWPSERSARRCAWSPSSAAAVSEVEVIW